MKHESLIVIVVLGILCWFTVYGIYTSVWSVPDKKAEIISLQARLAESQAENEKLKVGMKFESLFWTIADPDQIVDFEALNKYIREKQEFCLEAVE